MAQTKLKQASDLALLLALVFIGDLMLMEGAHLEQSWVSVVALMLVFYGVIRVPSQINLIIFDKQILLSEPMIDTSAYREMKEETTVFQLVTLMGLVSMLTIQALVFMWILEQ